MMSSLTSCCRYAECELRAARQILYIIWLKAVTFSRVLEGGALTLKRAESSNSQPTGRVLVVSGEACLWLLWLLYGAEHVTCPDDMHADDDDYILSCCRKSRIYQQHSL
jgi:hypothetical protein